MKFIRSVRDIVRWILVKLLAAATLVVGNVSWKPPMWARHARRGFNGAPGWIVCCAIAGFALIAWLQVWRDIQPIPEVVTTLVYRPGIPAVSELPSTPPTLEIKFSKAAAPLDRVDRPVDGVKIEPEMPGRWAWRGDRSLVFHPVQHWPAGTEFQVTLPENALLKNLALDSREVRFKTKPFEAKIESLSIKLDPRDESRREIWASIQFTHPVAADRLKEALFAETVGGLPLFQGKVRAPQISVKLVRQGRLAFVNVGAVDLPSEDDFAKLTIDKSLRPVSKESSLADDISQTVKIASAANFFQIDSVTSQIVCNEEGVPEQILVVKTSSDAKKGSLDKHVTVHLLPPPGTKEENGEDESPEESVGRLPAPASWKSLSAIPEDVLKNGEKLEPHPLAAEHELTQIHSYRVNVPVGGNLLLSVAAGAKGYGGYELKSDYAGYTYLPGTPAEIDVVSRGAILALAGEKKISIKTRRLEAVKVEICRIFPDEVNHLVSQTRGDFSRPQFENWKFNEENISVISERIISVNGQHDSEAKYISFDFKQELEKVEPRLGGGLFILRMSGWDMDRKRLVATQQRRFVLVTDLGIIVKEGADGSRNVFIQSLAKGEPVGGVEVMMLGKNGQPLESVVSGDGGQALLQAPNTHREKEPVALVARYGNDVAFLPFDREDRVVDTSNYDTGGVSLPRPEDLQAFGFTDRGVYRPGDLVHIGILLKRRDWAVLPSGLPVKVEIFDSRGKSVFLEKQSVKNVAMLEFQYETSQVSATGTYQYEIFVGDGTKERNLLFSDFFRVEDFEPDRMKIEASLASNAKAGWIHRHELKLAVNLQHLFGASASNCEIKGTIQGVPWTSSFSQFPGWTFFQRGKEVPYPHNWSEAFTMTTDSYGSAEIEPTLTGFPETGLTITADVMGYEPDGGRYVSTRKSISVSPFAFLLGWKSKQDLSFLTKDLDSEIEIIAVGPDLKKVEMNGLKARVISIQQVSALIQDENGSFRYRSVSRETVASEEPLIVKEAGTVVELPTQAPGSFRLEIVTEDGEHVLSAPFHVAGKGDSSVALEKSAEMESAISNAAPQPGETVTLSLKTPYLGSGLITIERENVVSYQWFKAETTSSVHAVRIPDSFEGSGYIVVSMLRSLDSEEIFANPHSHCVAPFEVIPAARKLGLNLDLPEKVKPGESLKIKVQANRPCKAVVFAVDEGILQVSDYETPAPLAGFFEKRALLVQTSQILDQLMPEYSLLLDQSAFGGDGEEKLAKNLNPFSRVTEKPVVYWSGVLDAGPEGTSCVYEVPDYFDGSLRVMVVALGQDGSDSMDSMVKVAGPFVLQPSAPLVVAPGDEMIATVHVTRLADDFPADTPIEVTCAASENTRLLEPRSHKLVLAPGANAIVTFRVQALDRLGPAELRFAATGGGHNSSRRRTMSVRPIFPYLTSVRTGTFKTGKQPVDLDGNLRPEYLKRRVAASRLPMSLAAGLAEYLAEFPHGCTEQTTSKAFCRLLLSGEQEFGLTREAAAKQIAAALGILRTRQSNEGTFGLWEVPSNEPTADWLSCYVVDFLIEARSAGFEVPDDMLVRANRHLDKVASVEPRGLDDARAAAYAIYLLTRQGIVTTNLLLHLRDRLAAAGELQWRNDVTGLYVAGTHALLLQRSEAQELFEAYRKAGSRRVDEFFNKLVGDSVYVTLASRHAQDLLRKQGSDATNPIVAEIASGHFNTIASAYAVQALRAFAGFTSQSTISLGVEAWDSKQRPVRIGLTGQTLLRGVLPDSANRLSFNFESQRGGGSASAYYQVIESGFARASKPFSRGIEVSRIISVNGNYEPRNIKLGDTLHVQIRVRATNGADLRNVTIVDLLPAGFELKKGDVRPGGGVFGFDYVDVREDRIVYYGDISGNYRQVNYRLTPISRGRYQVPPLSASSMYDLSLSGMSDVQTIEIIEAK